MSMGIHIGENNGIVSTGDNTTNTMQTSTGISDLKWKDIEAELQLLSRTTNYKALKEFAAQAEEAVKHKDENKLLSAAKKIGRLGWEFLKEASFNVLAEIVARAIFP